MKVPVGVDSYVEGGSVSVITKGEIKWTRDLYIWLPDNVAYELVEAGVLKFAKLKSGKTDKPDVNVYHLE